MNFNALNVCTANPKMANKKLKAMTPEITHEGNLLIGKFIGLPGNHCKYHERWDYLMPIIEKISRIKIEWEDAEYNDTYYPRTFGMISPSGNLMVRINANQVFEAPTLIEAAWLAVVDFVKWHNAQIKSLPL